MRALVPPVGCFLVAANATIACSVVQVVEQFVRALLQITKRPLKIVIPSEAEGPAFLSTTEVAPSCATTTIAISRGLLPVPPQAYVYRTLSTSKLKSAERAECDSAPEERKSAPVSA